MFTLLTALLLVFPSLLVRADNDWTNACAGSCSYESGDGVKKAWGTILIDGSPEAVSDISTAAGWSVMECDPESQDSQQVRLVCHDPASGCEQLFEGGATNTIVRLPDDCADAPFARVVDVTTSTNQTLTSKVVNRVAKAKVKRSTPPEVLTITFDFNFHLIPTSRGTVSLTALATTNPLQRPLVNAQHVRRALGYSENGPLNARRSTSAGELVSRELRRRDLFAEFVKGNTIPSGVTSRITDAPSASSNSSAISSKLGNWSKDWNKQFNLLDINDSFPVADAKLSCPQNGEIPAFDAKIKIDADVDVKATVTVGFILAGSILPPTISKAAFTSALDGHAAATFKISAQAQGSFNTGLMPLYSSGLAGLSVPGIIDIGPSFSINGQGVGKLGVSTEATVHADYQFPHLSMVFPQDQGESSGEATQANQNPLTLAIGGSAKLTGSVEAHLIPRVDLGVKVLSGAASASVFLQLDGYGALDMDLSIQGGASTTVGATENNKGLTATIDDLASPALATSTDSSSSTSATTEDGPSTTSSSEEVATTTEAKYIPLPEETPAPLPAAVADTVDDEDNTPYVNLEGSGDESSSNDAEDTPVNSPSTPVQLNTVPGSVCPSRRNRRNQKRDIIVHKPRDASGSYSGCVGVDMGVKIVAGAQGKLLSFWHDSVTFDLFSKKWDVFEKCFQGNLKKRSTAIRRGSFVPALPSPPSSLRVRQLDGLICPAVTDALSASNQIV